MFRTYFKRDVKIKNIKILRYDLYASFGEIYSITYTEFVYAIIEK